jgi:ABC-2 type transport system permease protein
MRFDLRRALTIARREYLTTVRRRAFLLTLVLIPVGYALLMTFMIRSQVGEVARSLGEFKSFGLVDSSGLFSAAPRRITGDFSMPALTPGESPRPAQRLEIEVRSFADQATALAALAQGEVQQVLVVPAGYERDGRARRYVAGSSIFGEGAEERQILRWMSRVLLAGHVDSLRAERVIRPGMNLVAYSLDEGGRPERRDERRELMEFLLPFLMAFLLGMAIITGGQYLLQGVSEEKESRILESMLTTVTPGDLIFGKLLGLGGAGLTLVLAWAAAGAAASGPALAAAGLEVSGGVVALMVLYFLLGYLFYGSIMTAIGALTTNLREAQQLSIIFTMLNFVPFYALPQLMSKTASPLAIVLSLFPPTAPTAMMLRLASGAQQVPAWQVAASLAALLLTALATLWISARVFRIGLLMYGKAPNLPEIMRWIGQR